MGPPAEHATDRIVLASASPRRRVLLAQLGEPFEVRPADVDETPPADLAADEVAAALALRKARAIAAAPGDLVLGADTLVVGADGTLLGKPEDAADAERILGCLSGTTHRVITGVALVRGEPAFERSTAVVTWITMRTTTRDERAAYIATGEPFGKAGAYAIQEHGDRFVTRIVGPWDNVVGLPLDAVRGLLDAARAQSSA